MVSGKLAGIGILNKLLTSSNKLAINIQLAYLVFRVQFSTRTSGTDGLSGQSNGLVTF